MTTIMRKWLVTLQPCETAPGVGLPEPGGGLREAASLRSQAIPPAERGIIWMRAALAQIPERALTHRAPWRGRSQGTRHGRRDGEPGYDGPDPHPLGHRA